METNATEAEGVPGNPAVGASAPWSHVSFSPPSSWIESPSYDSTVSGKDGTHITALLWERQVNVEDETSFHCTAMRLETPLAVQHQSQWRLNLDPRFNRLSLHWLRVVRSGKPIDQLQRERVRLIQRETQLERLVIDGQWTLLVVLDDVRPGDIIEAGYSYAGRHPIRPGGCEVMFNVPGGLVVDHYRLRVEFAGSRPNMGWLASADAPPLREEKLPDGRVRWTWEARQPVPRVSEPNLPGNFFDFVWVQVSDLKEWHPLTTRLAEVWGQAKTETEWGHIPAFARPTEVNEASVVALVQHIQDEFRYLSVDLENGGWIPMEPAAVARRRYGDCKDLVWLATCILRSWGVVARPILVGTGIREKASAFRPMSLLFNHAVLEVAVAGKTRWFDLTLRHQGGDFTSQVVPWFGQGLPVDGAALDLSEQPAETQQGIYAIRETYLLDTRRGEKSVFEIRIRAEGPQADGLRANRQAQGSEQFNKDRLAQTRRFFAKAERIGQLQWRDDRARNVCELVEAFEIRDFVNPDEQGNRVTFDLPPNVILRSLTVPEDKTRKAPWAMPALCEIRHQITVKAPSMGARPSRRWRWVRPEFTATFDHSMIDGQWSKTASFAIKVLEISADRVPVYKRELNEFLQATTWRLYLPLNLAGPSPNGDFGQLPSMAEGISAYVPAPDLRIFSDAPPNLEDSTKPQKIEAKRPRTFNLPNPPVNVWRFVIPGLVVLSMIARGCAESH